MKYYRQSKLYARKLISDFRTTFLHRQQHFLDPEIYHQKNWHVFFGYYDISSISNDETMLLAVHIKKTQTYPPGTPALIGYYALDDQNKEFHAIGETRTWCWQQSCRLQWYPSTGKSQTVFYNSMANGKYCGIIQNVATQQILCQIKRPLYSISNDGRFGLSLDFSRLQRLRPGYGYSILPDSTVDDAAPRQSGIWLIDLKTEKEQLIFSTASIVDFEPLESMKGTTHYFNHLLFSPDGKRFLFFHCWTNGARRYVRCLTCNRDGSDLYPLVNEGHASHYTWKNSKEVLVYATHKNEGTHYYVYMDKSPNREIIGNNVLCEDGHPSFVTINADEYLLLDTYPDKAGYQKLLLYNCRNKLCLIIGKFFAPLYFRGETRCDLHPRTSKSGRYIAFDAIKNGVRCLNVLDLKQQPGLYTDSL